MSRFGNILVIGFAVLFWTSYAYATAITSKTFLSSDTTYDTLQVNTGAALISSGHNITVNGKQSSTTGTLIYGELNLNVESTDGSMSGTSTLFTQKDGYFETSGSGDVLMSGTSAILLAATGSSISNQYNLTVLSGSLNNLYVDAGLRGYWRFDDGTGTTALDHSRYGHHGTLNNMDNSDWIVTTNSGTIKFFDPYALDFDGTDDFVQMTDVDTLDLGEEATISAWINMDTNTGFPIVVDNMWTLDTNGYQLYISSTNAEGCFGNGSSAPCVTGASGLGTDTWYHLAVTTDNALNMTAYVDGVQDGTATDPGTADLNPGDNTRIGRNRTGTEEFNGRIDDVRIYSRELTAGEISRLASGHQGAGSGYYTLGEALTVTNLTAIYDGTLSASGQSIDTRSWTNHSDFENTDSDVFLEGPQPNKVKGNTVFDTFGKAGTGTGEFYIGSSINQTTATSTGVDVVTLTVDRTSQTETKDFIVIGSWGVGTNDTSAATSSAALIINGVEQNDHDLIDWGLSQDGLYHGEMVMTKTSLDTSSHTIKISLQNETNTSGDEAIMIGAQLVVWEIPIDMVYKENVSTITDNNADSLFTDAVTLSYDARTEDVLIVATADVEWDDDDDPGALRITNGGTEVIRHEPDAFYDPNNDNKFHPVALSAFVTSQNGDDISVALQTKDGGTGDGMSIKNVRMFALPLGSFTYSVSTNSDQSTSSTSYVDLLSLSDSLTGSLVTFFGSQFGGSVTSSEPGMRIDFAPAGPDGTWVHHDNFGEYVYNGTDNGSEPGSLASIWGFTDRENTTTWKIQHKASVATSNNADRNFILALEADSDLNKLIIDHTTRQSFSGRLVLRGNDNSSTGTIAIRSSSGGELHNLLLDGSTGSGSLAYLNVQDSDGTGGNLLDCDIVNNGATCVLSNTVNWEAGNIGGSSNSDFTRIFSDQFTVTSNTGLGSHIPTNQGDSWTQLFCTGCSGDGLRVYFVDYVRRDSCGSGDGTMYTADATYGSADYVVELNLLNADNGNDYHYIGLRVQDSNNMYALRLVSGEGQMFKRVGGTWSSLASAVSNSSINDGVQIFFRAVGSTISWGTGQPHLDDDDDCSTGTTCTELQSVTDTSHSTAGKAALAYGNVGQTAADCSIQRTDDFEVYTTVAAAAEQLPDGQGSPIWFIFLETWKSIANLYKPIQDSLYSLFRHNV